MKKNIKQYPSSSAESAHYLLDRKKRERYLKTNSLTTKRSMDSSKNDNAAGQSTFSSQNGSYSSNLQSCLPEQRAYKENFGVSFAANSETLSSERDGHGRDRKMSEDYPSETRSIVRNDSAFSVPLIRVEDWSSSESDIEDDFNDSLPPFRFVGTRKKVTLFRQFSLELVIITAFY